MRGGGGFGDMRGAQESGDFTIYGINSYAFIDDVENGTMSISSGTYFDENSADGVMISYDLAETNGLEVGDTITLQTLSSSDVTLTILGIYDNASNFSSDNIIYMNVDAAAKFLDESSFNEGNFYVDNVSYDLNNAEEAEALINWINENYPELAEQNITASEDVAAYERMVGPIESVGSFATTLLIVVIIASVVIITLIVTINVKDRRYEMGVLLSLGAKKVSIIGQIFIEMALVGTVAFVGACFSSTALASVMGQGILDSEIAAAQTESENNFGRPGTKIGGGQTPEMPNNFSANSTNGSNSASESTDNSANESAPSDSIIKPEDDTISEININAKFSDILILFVAGYSIILVALVIPAASILRYEPKQILGGKE